MGETSDKGQTRVIFKRLLRYISPYKKLIFGSMMASLVVAGSSAVIAKAVEPMIDLVLLKKNQGLIKWVPLFAVLIMAINGMGKFFQEYFLQLSAQNVVKDLRNAMYTNTLGLPMRFFVDNSSAVTLSRIMNDVSLMQYSISQVVVGLVQDGAMFIGLLVVAYVADWQLSLMATVAIPLVAIPASEIGRRIKRYTKKGQGAMADLTMALEQSFSGIKVIKSFGTEKKEIQGFLEKNTTYFSLLKKTIRYDAMTSPMVAILTSFGIAAVIWYGFHRTLNGELTQGQLFSILVAIIMMLTPLKKLAKTNNKLQHAVGAAERIFDLLDEVSDLEVQQPSVSPGKVQGDIRFENVSFAYKDEPVLQNLSFEARSGEIVALVGPSGAGKSTVASLVCRFFDPQQGGILLDGIELQRYTMDSLKRQLAFVDQETFLFNDSVLNNIRYGRPEATPSEVRAAAQKAFADEFILDMPEGYETRIGDRGVRLSGGQRQRLCIARAILRDAPILVLDEATSALDTESESVVQQALVNLMENRTTLVIAHRLSTVMHADKILVLQSGMLEDEGSHEELLGRGGLYRKLYDMQFSDAP